MSLLARARIACIVVLSCLFGPVHSAAQWEAVYGGPSCPEAAYKGVQLLAPTTCLNTGGAVAAGVSYSSSSNCATADAYVVRFNEFTGAIIWQNTYDINDALRNDSATSIAQISDGFIVVGNTDQGQGNTDIFIMKLYCDGSLAWVRTYGVANGTNVTSDDQANDVVIATSGSATNGTAAGDIIVCGHSKGTTNPGGGTVYGYLLRTTSAGAVIWDARYNMPYPHMGETMWFKSLIQAVPTGGQTTGDVVAVGATDMVGNALEALAVRVDGDNGGMLANPPSYHGMATYGSTRIDEFWSVIEHSTTPALPARQARHLIFAGETSLLNARPENTAEIYIVKTTGDPTVPVVEVTVGDGVPGEYWEEAHSVIESGLTNGPVGPTDLVLTGFWVDFMGGFFTHRDAILLGMSVPVVQPTPPLPPAIPTILLSRRYGGQAGGENDYGHSIDDIANVGWLIAGASSSDLKNGLTADPGDMYVLQPDDATGATGDCSEDWNPTAALAAYGAVAHAPLITTIGLSESSVADSYWPTWAKTSVCPRPFGKPVIPNDLRQETGQRFGAFPNPVERGDEIKVSSAVPVGGTVEVSVIDARGEIALVLNALTDAGATVVRIPTISLVPGFYSVRLTVDGRSRFVPFFVR